VRLEVVLTRTSRITPWLLALALSAVLALALAACGDDDDDGGPFGDDAAGEDRSGDDDSGEGDDAEPSDDDGEEPSDDGDDSGNDGPFANKDEEYVDGVCTAVLDFNNEVERLGLENPEATEEEAAELVIEPLDVYIAALKDLDPPDDAEDFHNEVVALTEEVRDRIEAEGNLDALAETEPAEAPADVRDRLNGIVAENETCQEAGFTIG
jgi:hypothetical protein